MNYSEEFVSTFSELFQLLAWLLQQNYIKFHDLSTLKEEGSSLRIWRKGDTILMIFFYFFICSTIIL